MSDQPITGVPPAQPAAPAKVPGRGGIWLGVLLMVLGLVGAVTTFIVQRESYSGSVENLVRALPGYRTELLFEKTGTFTFYYEYAGTFETTLDGTQQTITLDAPPTPPEIDARLFDQNGDEVRLVSGVGDISYDVSGFKGVAINQADIEQEGSYTFEVVSTSDSTFAVAAGKGTIEEPSAVLPAIIAAVGLLLGLLVIVVSASRRARARRAAPQVAVVPSVLGPPGAYPSPGAAVGARPTDTIWAQTAPGQATAPPTWATSPPPPAAPTPPAAPPAAPAPPPPTWAAPGTPDGAPPRPDAPTVQTPVTTPMPVQAPPAAPAPAPSFPPPGGAAPPAAQTGDEDENPPAPSPWGAPTPPSS